MSSEAPPTYDVDIYIPEYWKDQTTSGFDKTYADNHYLKFPVAQGTEYLSDIVVSGGSTLSSVSASSLQVNGNTNVTGKTTTANIDMVNSSSTLDMKTGNITNVTNINGVAYPQSAGINSVLQTGNTATDKTMIIDDSITYNYTSLNNEGFFASNGNGITENIVNIGAYNGVGSPTHGIKIYDTIGTSGELTIQQNQILLNGFSPSASNTMNYTSSIIQYASATFKAFVSGGNSSVITPNSIYTYLVDGATTNFSRITDSGLNIVGSTSSITNNLNSASNTISDGIRTLSSAIVSNVPTFKALTATGGNSTIITPNSIYTYLVDGAITNFSSITGSNIKIQGATSINNTIDASNCNIFDETVNSRYISLSSGGHSATGNSILTAGSYLYMGSTAPDASPANTPTCLLTPSSIGIWKSNLYKSPSGQTGNYMKYDTTLGLVLGYNNAGSMQFLPSNTSLGLRLELTNDYFGSNGSKASLLIQNSGAGTGTTQCNSLVYKRTKNTSITAGDYIGTNQYFMNNSALTLKEYGRMSCIARNVASGNEDGNFLFEVAVNGTLTSVLELNGDQNQINAFKPLDMNGNDINTISGNITIDATTSSGTGVVNIKTKDGTAGSGEGLVLTGNTLLSATAGGNSGQHLCLTIGGVAYKIALLEP